MKLSEIVLESWVDKFDKIERNIRSKNMTMGELEHFMFDNLGVLLQPETDPTVRPYTVGGASIHPQPITAQDTPNQELHGKYLLDMELGPGVTSNTPANDVIDLFSRLRHELSHLQLAHRLDTFPNYIDPDQNVLFSPKTGLYRLQPVERQAQAEDAAEALVTLKRTPSDLERSIDTVYEQIKNSSSVSLRVLQKAVLNVTYRMLNITDRQSFGAHAHKHPDLYQAFNALGMMIGEMVLLRAIAHKSTTHRVMIRQQYHLFMKAVKKVYPKMKGYMKTHEKEREDTLRRTASSRQKIQAQIARVNELLNTFAQLSGS